MQNRRVCTFNEGNVVTGLTNSGQFVAFRQDEEHPRGYGHSHWAAIADLNEKIGADEPEAVDHQSARFDHAQDHRKNWVA